MTFAAIGTAARADVLLLDGIEMNAATAASRPKSGTSMAAVESTFGAPTEKHAPVGDPPITRWDYPGFSVYFEHQLVLHSVVRR
jgi:hypothetical protein